MIVGYARVSSREQGFTGALEQQKSRLERYGVASIITDVDSGRNDRRSGFSELWGLIEKGQITAVVATRCDRLTRSIITLKKFFEHCSSHGVQVVVLDDAIDTTTAAGKFHLNMLGSLAEMESDRLSERVKFGHDYHRRMGKPYFACFGYRKVGDRLELDDVPLLCEIATGEEWSKAGLARLRIDLVFQHGSLLRALKAYNDRFGLNWRSYGGRGNQRPKGSPALSNSGFGTWICNPTLRGHIAYGRGDTGRVKYEDEWELLPNQHQPLMTEAEWGSLRDLLLGNSRKFGGAFAGSSNRPFLGLVRCGSCGYACGYNSHRLRTDPSVRKYRYCCRRHSFEDCCDQKRGVKEEVIRERIIEALVSRAGEILGVESGGLLIESDSREITSLRSQLKSLLTITPQSPVIQSAIQEIKREITQLQVKQSVEQNAALSRLGELRPIFQDPDYWRWLEVRLTPAQVRANYRRWVKSVTIQDGLVAGIELLI